MKPDKLISAQQAAQIRDKARGAGQRVVFTNGCFDLLHPGHVDFLSRARALGDLLIVGLNSDASVRRLKGRDRPLFGEVERAIVLCALRAVDYVVLFPEETPLSLIRKLVPDVLVKGHDWPVDEIVGRDVVRRAGGEVVSLPSRFPQYSSSALLQRLRSASETEMEP